MPIAGFEPRKSDIQNDRSANYAKTIAQNV